MRSRNRLLEEKEAMSMFRKSPQVKKEKETLVPSVSSLTKSNAKTPLKQSTKSPQLKFELKKLASSLTTSSSSHIPGPTTEDDASQVRRICAQPWYCAHCSYLNPPSSAIKECIICKKPKKVMDQPIESMTQIKREKASHSVKREPSSSSTMKEKEKQNLSNVRVKQENASETPKKRGRPMGSSKKKPRSTAATDDDNDDDEGDESMTDEPEVVETWPCSQCTYFNLASESVCEMCETPRVSKDADGNKRQRTSSTHTSTVSSSIVADDAAASSSSKPLSLKPLSSTPIPAATSVSITKKEPSSSSSTRDSRNRVSLSNFIRPSSVAASKPSSKPTSSSPVISSANATNTPTPVAAAAASSSAAAASSSSSSTPFRSIAAPRAAASSFYSSRYSPSFIDQAYKVCPICSSPSLRSAKRCVDRECGWNYTLKCMDELSSGKCCEKMSVDFPPYARPLDFTSYEFALPTSWLIEEEKGDRDDQHQRQTPVSTLKRQKSSSGGRARSRPQPGPSGVAARLSVIRCDCCASFIPLSHQYYHCSTCDQKNGDDYSRAWCSIDFCYDCYHSSQSLSAHEIHHEWVQRRAEEEQRPHPSEMMMRDVEEGEEMKQLPDFDSGLDNEVEDDDEEEEEEEQKERHASSFLSTTRRHLAFTPDSPEHKSPENRPSSAATATSSHPAASVSPSIRLPQRPARNVFTDSDSDLDDSDVGGDEDEPLLEFASPSQTEATPVPSTQPLADHDSLCFYCSDGGKLLLCDHCVRSYHRACVQKRLSHLKKWTPNQPFECSMIGETCSKRAKCLTLECYAIVDAIKRKNSSKSKYVHADSDAPMSHNLAEEEIDSDCSVSSRLSLNPAIPVGNHCCNPTCYREFNLCDKWFRCRSCLTEQPYDLCGTCVDHWQTIKHPRSHRFSLVLSKIRRRFTAGQRVLAERSAGKGTLSGKPSRPMSIRFAMNHGVTRSASVPLSELMSPETQTPATAVSSTSLIDSDVLASVTRAFTQLQPNWQRRIRDLVLTANSFPSYSHYGNSIIRRLDLIKSNLHSNEVRQFIIDAQVSPRKSDRQMSVDATTSGPSSVAAAVAQSPSMQHPIAVSADQVAAACDALNRLSVHVQGLLRTAARAGQPFPAFSDCTCGPTMLQQLNQIEASWHSPEFRRFITNPADQLQGPSVSASAVAPSSTPTIATAAAASSSSPSSSSFELARDAFNSLTSHWRLRIQVALRLLNQPFIEYSWPSCPRVTIEKLDRIKAAWHSTEMREFIANAPITSMAVQRLASETTDSTHVAPPTELTLATTPAHLNTTSTTTEPHASPSNALPSPLTPTMQQQQQQSLITVSMSEPISSSAEVAINSSIQPPTSTSVDLVSTPPFQPIAPISQLQPTLPLFADQFALLTQNRTLHEANVCLHTQLTAHQLDMQTREATFHSTIQQLQSKCTQSAVIAQYATNQQALAEARELQLQSRLCAEQRKGQRLEKALNLANHTLTTTHDQLKREKMKVTQLEKAGATSTTVTAAAAASSSTHPAVAASPSSSRPPPTSHIDAQCTICWDRSCDVVFLPCKHLVTCQKCSAHTTLTKCTRCQKTIHKKIQIKL